MNDDQFDEEEVPLDSALEPVRRERERAKVYQLESLAQMAVLGLPTETMATATGLSHEFVDRLLRKRANKTFVRFYEKYQRQRTVQATEGYFRLAGMLDKAYDGIEASLDAPDLRLRSENSWRLVERYNPDPNRQRDSGHGDINVTVNAPHIQTQIKATMNAVAESLVGLHGAIAAQDPNAHILVGTEALPTPPSQLEVSEGEAPLALTASDPLRDLLTEVVDRED